MKNTGIVRRLDNLGRITLPKEMRKSLGIETGDGVEISIEGENVILKKFVVGDIFDGARDNLVEYKGKLVSRNSIKALAKIAGYKIN